MDNGNTISRFALLCVAGSIPGFLAIVNDIREKLRTANSGMWIRKFIMIHTVYKDKKLCVLIDW